MSDAVIDCTTLSDREVGLKILFYLNAGYSPGGVSIDRSLRSVLLSRALNLLHFDWRQNHPPLAALLEEAERRTPKKRYLPVCFGHYLNDITLICDQHLGMLMLYELRDWYNMIYRTKQGMFYHERRQLLDALRLLPQPRRTTPFLWTELRMEGDDRRNERSAYERDQRDRLMWAEFNISSRSD
jgi:hypothetical protein